MQRVGAAPRHDVDVAAERAAELRLAAAGDDLELLDRVDAERDAAEPGGVVVGRQAVDDEAVREVALAGDREALAGHAEVSANSCVLLVLVGETPGTSSARSRKLRPFIGRFCTSACGTVPAIWLRAVSSACVVGDDGHRGVEAGDVERDGDVERRAGAQRERARVVLEALQLRPELVRADPQIGEAEPAVRVRGRLDGDVGRRLARADDRAGHGPALRIEHAAADRGLVDRFLRGCQAGRGQTRHDEPDEPPRSSSWNCPSGGLGGRACACGRPSTHGRETVLALRRQSRHR